MLSVGELTAGERLRVARRREGLTQAKAADKLGMPLGAYKDAEADKATAWDIEQPALNRLEPHEACFIRRRREGWTLDELSARIGLTKWWLCLMEQGKAPTGTLEGYWFDPTA